MYKLCTNCHSVLLQVDEEVYKERAGAAGRTNGGPQCTSNMSGKKGDVFTLILLLLRL